MNSNINLVAHTTDELEKKLKRLRLTRIIAISCLTFVAIASITIFFLNTQIPISAIKKSQQAALSDLSLVKDKAAKLYLEKDRINNISSLIKRRTKYVENILLLIQNLQPGLTAESVSVEKGQMRITVNGTSLDELNNFIDVYVDIGNQKKSFSKLSIESLTFIDVDSTYSLLLKADLL